MTAVQQPLVSGDPALRWDSNNLDNEGYEEFEDDESNSAKLFERSRIRALADERESVQKKTFAKWVNSHLMRVSCNIQDLYVDLRDGKMLIKLLEVLSGERLPNPTKGKMRIHCLENVDKSLTFLNEMRVHLENMGAHDIVDGNPRLTLGLIWTIILRFQIQDITVEHMDTSEVKSAKDALLLWCQMKTAGYPNVNVRNFTTSWRDGLAFNALIHKHRPDIIEYNKLTKANPLHNLNNAFTVADQKLGLTPLLEAEDVNVEYPDEKSIITYVVTYYHYFSKMKAESVQGRRVGKVINQCRDYDSMINDYETMTSDLLEWIKKTIEALNDRHFTNSLSGVQQQLASFNGYRTVEKPPKFVEKGNLEILLFSIQSQMRANNQKPYTPAEGRLISDLNRAWDQLEKAEHERELALRDELIRQEKLAQLAARFDRKAGMRESWLSENQRLVAQDNFGFDLAAVEAAVKKHEAIETDIRAYEERVQAVVAVAQELETEVYHDVERVNARKDNVLRLWEYLLELLRARRMRLGLTHDLQKVFMDMLFAMETIEETAEILRSEDIGKHLAGVEDLLQKHDLIEADINVVAERVKTVNQAAQYFVDTDFPEASGDPDHMTYRPCDPAVIIDRQRQLNDALEQLQKLAGQRRQRLDDSRLMWQFYRDMADAESWIREKEQLMSSPDLGHDLTSIGLLQSKHRATEDELAARHAHLVEEFQVGQDLIAAGNFGAPKIAERIAEVEGQWRNLQDLSDYRRKRISETVDYYQFFADADDVDTWMLDTLRLVTSDDVGHDEASVQSLVKKHKLICEELDEYRNVLDGLKVQSEALSPQDRDSPEVVGRLASIERRYHELLEMAEIRKQRLLDALALYRIYNEADSVDQWITEKEKLLHTMVAKEDIEEVEILKARFDTFDKEMAANEDKVTVVGQLANQLVSNEHPNSPEVADRERQLRNRWDSLRTVADEKKDALQLAHDVNMYNIDTQELATWIRDKEKLIESTDELGNDLGGIITLQRRLSGLERDLAAIDERRVALHAEADRLADKKPSEAEAIREKAAAVDKLHDDLKNSLKVREERLGEASDLQKFLQDLDHFQQWLTRTQTTIASETMPIDVAEAELLLSQHDQLKSEIDGWASDYQKMKAYGETVVEGQEDVQYMFLRERLKALDDGWNDLARMWDNKRNALIQNLNLQSFMRDARQAEILLSEQDNYLAKEDIPTTPGSKHITPEAAENQIKMLENFIATMDANNEKINGVISFADKLVEGNHYASDKIRRKADSLAERRLVNRNRALEKLNRLKDVLHLQKFFQDCDELNDWIAEKNLAAQDETYREAKNIHSKWLRHQAFESEIRSNKDQLDKLVGDGQDIIAEKADLAEVVQPRIDELVAQWNSLEKGVADKGERLFDENRGQLYEQSVDDIDGWVKEIESQIVTEDVAHDLTTINLLMQKQNVLESQLKVKEEQVKCLENQAVLLREVDPDKERELADRKAEVEDRFTRLLAPLIERRQKLDQIKRVKQFLRDVEDEKLWIAERLARARSTNYGNSLLTVQMLLGKNRTLRNEIDSHEPTIINVVDMGLSMIEDGHPDSEVFQKHIDELNASWAELQEAVDEREARIKQSEVAQQYFFDASESEAWMSEQELYMMSGDKARDEVGAANMLKKHGNTEKTVEDYADVVRELGDRARQLCDENHPDRDAIAVKQAQVDKLYASLKDLSGDRRLKLDEVLKLYLLNRDIEDLEQWIAEREVVAGSHELGQDFEHVTMLRDRFKDFAGDTESIGQERVAAVNEACDRLIATGHSDAAVIAEWKDTINEMWTDLLEMIDTRTQMLAASYELFKFYNDCKETLDRIHEKEVLMPDEIGRDAQTTAALQRRHLAYEHELIALGLQVQLIQEAAANLIVAYSGEKAREIQNHEMEVVDAWRKLQIRVDGRRGQLADSNDLFRFFNMVRDLVNWMNDISRQMNSQDKPRDVSGVELLMNNHQSLKAEIDARAENFTICVNLGKDIVSRRHPSSPEVREKLLQLATQRGTMMEQWEDRWEHLQLILEVYQFARDAAVAESWLLAHESYIHNEDYGETLAAVELLIKKHESFEKSAATQDERFRALERLTTFELREQQKKEHPADSVEASQRRRPNYVEHYKEQFVPPLEPVRVSQPEPVQQPLSSDEQVVKVEAAAVETSITTPGKAKPEERQPVTPVERQPDSSVERKPVKPVKRGASGKSVQSQAAASIEGEEGSFSGLLIRKHQWESTTKKASHRGWDKVFVVLANRQLSFYKDQKHAKTEPKSYFHHEQPIDLEGASAAVATDYGKRPHVFRVKLGNGGDFLFQCRDEDEMNAWMSKVNTMSGASGDQPLSPARASTLPMSVEGPRSEEPKKRGFFTLGKKKERDT